MSPAERPGQDAPGALDPVRVAFDRTRTDADSLLRRDGDPATFAVWLLGVIRRQGDRYLRYAVLDGAMSAMDDDEVRRG